MPLHVAASVQRVGIEPRGTVRHQSILLERRRARGLSAASPRLLEDAGPAGNRRGALVADRGWQSSTWRRNGKRILVATLGEADHVRSDWRRESLEPR